MCLQCIHACIYVYTYIYIYIYTYVCVCGCVCMYMWLCSHVLACVPTACLLVMLAMCVLTLIVEAAVQFCYVIKVCDFSALLAVCMSIYIYNTSAAQFH